MPKELRRVVQPVKVSNPLTQTYQYAAVGELLEVVTMPGTTDSPDDVRVYRTNEKPTTRSHIVSRSELVANTELVSE